MRTRLVLVLVGLVAIGLAAAVATGVVDPSALLSSAPTPIPHAVVRGDTLSKLARANGRTVAELKQWNGLSSDRIDVGQVLVVGWSEGSGPGVPESAGSSRSPQKPQKTRPRTTSSTPSSSSLPTLPPERPCLAGPSVDGGGDDPEFAASAGLSYAQTKGAMDAFLPTVQRCIEGDWPEGTVKLSITVACTGRVDRVSIADDGGLPATLTGCIADTLRYAPFPAHDLPDGETFTYPMTFSR